MIFPMSITSTWPHLQSLRASVQSRGGLFLLDASGRLQSYQPLICIIGNNKSTVVKINKLECMEYHGIEMHGTSNQRTEGLVFERIDTNRNIYICLLQNQHKHCQTKMPEIYLFSNSFSIPFFQSLQSTKMKGCPSFWPKFSPPTCGTKRLALQLFPSKGINSKKRTWHSHDSLLGSRIGNLWQTYRNLWELGTSGIETL